MTIICPECRMRYHRKLSELPKEPIAKLQCGMCEHVFEWVRPKTEEELERAFWNARWELENPSEKDETFLREVKVQTKVEGATK